METTFWSLHAAVIPLTLISSLCHSLLVINVCLLTYVENKKFWEIIVFPNDCFPLSAFPLSTVKHNDGPSRMGVGPDQRTRFSPEKVKGFDEVLPVLNAFPPPAPT